MRGGGGGAGPAFGPAPFLLGGVGAAKGLLPCFLVPTRNQPTACTLALWWLKFGPTEPRGGGGGLEPPFKTPPPPLEGALQGQAANGAPFLYPPFSRADGVMDVQPF